MDTDKLQAWFRVLNHEDSVPARGYRRDVREYALISYVNNIIGCYLSDNYHVIPIFIERARIHMKDHEANESTSAYYERVAQFLNDMESFISEKASVTTIR
jgi:hypothetical protein